MTILWDWSWQLCDCELHRLRCIDRIVTSLHRKKKCALLSLHKDWLTKHTSYARSCKELPALVDWSELTFINFDKIDVQDSSWKSSQKIDVQWSCWVIKFKMKVIDTSFKKLLINYLNLCSVKMNLIFDCLTFTQAWMLMNLETTVFSEAQAKRNILSCMNNVVC